MSEPTDQEWGKARDLAALVRQTGHRDPDFSQCVGAIALALAEARTAERAYIIEQIRQNATELLFFAKGRALDLLAWILELPPAEGRDG